MLFSPTCAWAQSDAGATTAAQQADTGPPRQTPRRDPADPQDRRDPTVNSGSGDETVPQGSNDIVVTGTLVRGIAPPGASPITADQRFIRLTGATTVAQLLQTIPQLGSFGTLQQPFAASPEVSTNRPNLRNLPGFNNGGGSTTLVLVDGHRVVGMGNNSTNPDPDVLPPGIIDRVEIVPDGGSALYGSDAVAGVINFITLRRFNGIRADASYGLADKYDRWDANVTIGRDWESGSIYVSYNYAESSALFGRDRDYIRQFPNANGLTTLNCSPGNIEALAGVFSPAGTIVGVPRNGSVTTPNQCDDSDDATVYPSSQRHSVFAGLTQELAQGLTFEVRGFYTNRKTQVQSGRATFSQILVPQPLTAALQANGVPAISSPFETVAFGGFFNGQPIFVPNSPNTIDLVEQVDGQLPNSFVRGNIGLETFGINPSLTADLGHTFRLRVQAGYGESVSRFTLSNYNQIALQNAIVSGLFNPFTQAETAPGVVTAITNFGEFNRARQHQFDIKAIVDGDLFRLPAGAVKVAVGGEFLKESYVTANGQAVPGFEFSGAAAQSVNGTLVAPATTGVPRFDVDRTVKSVFGEVVAPIIDQPNGVSLTVSAAGRYDHYSDVGETFNPRFGATFKPVRWISLRGAWGRSFNTPSLADRQDAAITTAFVLTGAAAAFFQPPASLVGTGAGRYPAYTGGTIVALRGNAPGIQPQKAKTWNAGFDVQPPVVAGLNIGATYYNIRYNNLIGLAPFETPSILYRDFGNVITIAPSQALINAAISQANVVNGSTPVSAAGVYAFFDARKRNLGDFKLDGIDMRLNYQTQTGFGNVFANANGTYELNRRQSSSPGSAFNDVLSANASRFRIRSSIGAEIGPVLGQLTWNHIAGYKLDPAVGFVSQNRVSDFNTFDLYFRIAVPGIGPTHDTAITLNVDNVLDQDPPQYRGGSQIPGGEGIPFATSNTLGRFARIGLTTRF